MRSCMTKHSYTVGLFLLLVFGLFGCGEGQQGNDSSSKQGAGETPGEPEPIAQEDEEDDFILQAVSEKDTYEVGEEVDITAKLKYTGDEEEVTIAHAASPFYFEITEHTRDIHIAYPMNEPLNTTTLEQGYWHEEEYTKAGVHDGEFIEEFLEEDGFPAGEYTVEVRTDFSLGEDISDDRYELTASFDLYVVE